MTAKAGDGVNRGGALVTGAGRRLGRAMALGLGAAGFDVAAHYNTSAADAEAVAEELRKSGRKAAALGADLADETATAGLIARAEAAVGPLAVLVNSASLFENDDIDTMTRASWDAHMNANLRAPVKLAQDFAARARAANIATGKAESGRDEDAPGQLSDRMPDRLIVNLLDQRVMKLTPQFLSYTTSKAALFTLTTTLAQALGPRGVRVNAIAPGPTMRNARQSEADWQAQNAATLLGRGGRPDDIVRALLYLVDAHAVTGQTIAVDGGQRLAWETPDALVKE